MEWFTLDITLLVSAGLVILAPVFYAIAKHKGKWAVLAKTYCIISTATLIVLAGITVMSINRGLWTLHVPTTKIISTLITNKTPVDESNRLPEDTSGSIIALYRFACPDCEATHDELQAWADENDFPIWWVSSRSDVGSELLKNSMLHKVPSLIATNTEGKTFERVAYSVDAQNHAVLNIDALEDIEQFMKE